MTEAIAVARGEAEPVRMYIPSELDIRSIRRAVGMSQQAFAGAFGFSATQIRDWEQHRSRPSAPLHAYLSLIARDPVGVQAALRDVAQRRSKAA